VNVKERQGDEKANTEQIKGEERKKESDPKMSRSVVAASF
jgi:hypothetical protein